MFGSGGRGQVAEVQSLDEDRSAISSVQQHGGVPASTLDKIKPV